MSLALIRAEYAAQLNAIANIGAVHDYPRFAGEWQTFLNLFKDPKADRILGWEIAIESAPAGQRYISGVSPNAVMDIAWAIVIRGYMSLNDKNATSKSFDNLVDAILAKFRPLHDLSGKALKCDEMIASEIIHGPLGGVECHYVELHQTVWERVTY